MGGYGSHGGPFGQGWQGWENAAGQQMGPGGAWGDQSNMYSSTTAQGLYERAKGGDPAAVSEYERYVSKYYPKWGTQGGGQGTPGQSGGGGGGQSYGWGGNVSFPGSTTTIGQPGGPDPRQGGGRMQPQNPAQPWGNGGATDPFQGGGGGGATDPYLGGGWGGQTDPPQGGQGPRMSTQAGGYGQPDPFQGGWGGARQTMAGRMLGSMYGQRR